MIETIQNRQKHRTNADYKTDFEQMLHEFTQLEKQMQIDRTEIESLKVEAQILKAESDIIKARTQERLDALTVKA